MTLPQLAHSLPTDAVVGGMIVTSIQNTMKSNSNFDPEKIALIFYAVILLLVFVGGPAVFIAKTVTTQQALNQECNTNYNLLQVALAGDNLSRICQLKNQTPTIK